MKVAVTQTGLSGPDILDFYDFLAIRRNASALSTASASTYYDASDTPFATTNLIDDTAVCDGSLMGCAGYATATIDTSIPYSITEIFDVDFAAGYDDGDVSFSDTWSEGTIVPRPNTVPEPASVGLIGLGLLMVAVARRQSRPRRVARLIGA